MNNEVWVVANWKSNKNIAEALEWVSIVGPKLPTDSSLKVVVCPPFIDVEEVKKAVKVGGYPLMEVGSYTGEEAASIMQDVVDLAILGHSERRQNFAETDEMVSLKSKEAIKYNIIPLVCLQDENTPIPDRVGLVAYEPISAIGTGQADDPDNVQEVSREIKSKYPNVEILYGGSITPENALEFLSLSEINGLLIGKASLDPEEFLKIIERASLGHSTS
jgi:triosephosphate isomerase (TIM)